MAVQLLSVPHMGPQLAAQDWGVDFTAQDCEWHGAAVGYVYGSCGQETTVKTQSAFQTRPGFEMEKVGFVTRLCVAVGENQVMDE